MSEGPGSSALAEVAVSVQHTGHADGGGQAQGAGAPRTHRQAFRCAVVAAAAAGQDRRDVVVVVFAAVASKASSSRGTMVWMHVCV